MNQLDQKIANRKRVLGMIRRSPGISQAQLAATLGLRASTISYVTHELRELGLIRVVDRSASGRGGGKPAELLSLDAETGTFGGLYIRYDDLIVSTVDYSENPLDSKRIDIGSFEELDIMRILLENIERQKNGYDNYRGVGIAVSSVVNDRGSVASSSHFNRSIPDLLGTVESQFPDIVAVVENDANCCAIYDVSHSENVTENLIHLVISFEQETMGAGIVSDGRLYRGSRGAAGEIPEDDNGGTGSFLEHASRTVRTIYQLFDPDRIEYSCDEETTARKLARLLAGPVPASDGSRIRYAGSNELAVTGAALSAMERYTDMVLRT